MSNLRALLILSVLSGCSGGSTGKGPTLPAATSPAVTAVGEPQGAAATTMIGPSGGTASSADGKLELVVPAGALAADTAVSVTPLSVTAPGGLRAYRLGPEGTTFAVPASVRFTFADADVAGSSKKALRVAFQDGQRQWESISAVTVDADSVTVSTTHLSDWSLLLGYQIRPPTATVPVSETLDLSVRFCDLVTKDAQGKDLELVGLVAVCQEGDDLDPLLGVWSVNGVAGGSLKTGTVQRGQPAVFQAPDTAPSPSIVAVSVEFTPPRPGEAKTLLVSNISIGGGLPRTYSGMLTYHLKMGGPSTSILPFEVRMTAQVTLTRMPTSTSSYDLTTGPAVLTLLTKDTDLNCHCTAAPNVVGALDPDSFGLILDAKASTITTFQFGALFDSVPLTCVPSDCQAPSSAPELVVWALAGVNPACASDVQTDFTDPKQLSGSFSFTCPANPQVVGRVEETTWMLQGN